MISSTIDIKDITAQSIKITDDELIVNLSDGRTISIPLAWYPRLTYGTKSERNNWRFIAGGAGIHWPDLDEDISIEGIILGKPSYESQRSFSEWLGGRMKQLTKRKRGIAKDLAH